MKLDLRKALNTISDVVLNRPVPLREFDQIYMKVADMVIQAEFIARQFQDGHVVFIGDGDAISLSIMHLREKEVFDGAPAHILVLDFDERIVNSINRFARDQGLEGKIESILYNVCEPLPAELIGSRDAFYTNPPWGASNDGQSVTAFVGRGIEATKKGGSGAIVIADDHDLPWTGSVLFNTQKYLTESGFIVSEMLPELHKYHLDDAPELTSCCMLVRDIEQKPKASPSAPLDARVLENFYGRQSPLRYRYVRDRSGLNLGKAPDGSYQLIPLEEKHEHNDYSRK